MSDQVPVQWRLASRRETVRMGVRIAATARPGDLLVLAGDLGAGKTFLSRSIARALGVAREVRVTSPTFTLVHQYQARLPLVHADLYRITDPFGIEELGLQELRAEGALLLVEWGKPFIAELGGDALVLELDLRETGRLAEAYATGIRSAEWLAELQAWQAPVRGGSQRE